jgi:NDP-sugar pyrophosphorylase family protein
MNRLDNALQFDGGVAATPRITRKASMLETLKAVIVLGGSVRASRLRAAVRRSALELPIEPQRTLIAQWHEQISELSNQIGRGELQARILVDHLSPVPAIPAPDGVVAFKVERDPLEYRGTGGVILDLSSAYTDDDVLLVVNGAQLLLEPLADLAAALAEHASDVAVVSHRDGTPSGAMLLRCGVLKLISPAGFVDMKEQALPAIAKEHDVAVLERETASGLPVRTLASYIHALRMHQLKINNRPVVDDPFAENLRSSFSIVEAGATVHPTARVHDSVVLKGARVDAGAILVRSLICPGAVVRPEQRVVDRLLAGSGGPSAGGES